MKYLEFNYPNHQKIWGEEKWIISAHKNGEAQIKGLDKNLSEYYRENKNLFGDDLPDEFPLLVKIINTFDDLSIQVHPDDKYAGEYENSLGKSECWYILKADKADIIAGQKQITRDDVENAIANNTFLDLCDLKSIESGDFFYIPPGCIHAIRKNTSLLEIQQSSDITYRLYDYERRDDNGKLRELHISQSLDVIDYDYKNENKIKYIDDNTSNLVTCEYFYVDLIKNKKENIIKTNHEFKMIIAIGGSMYIDGNEVAENEGVIVLKNQSVTVTTENKLIVSGITR